MRKPSFRFLVAATALALAVCTTASAESVLRTNWIPASTGMGDLWTFQCPAGGTVAIQVQNRPDAYMGGGSPLDFYFQMIDPDGNVVGAGDDEVACLVQPSCFGCPRQAALPCTAAGTYSIWVSSYNNCSSGNSAAGYQLAVEVRDANANALAAAKVRLGGGPRSKVPKWHSSSSEPAINDGVNP